MARCRQGCLEITGDRRGTAAATLVTVLVPRTVPTLLTRWQAPWTPQGFPPSPSRSRDSWRREGDETSRLRDHASVWLDAWMRGGMEGWRHR